MSFVGAIGPVVKNAPYTGEVAVKCFHCGHIQKKYVNKNYHVRRTCKNCKVKTNTWFVGYSI